MCLGSLFYVCLDHNVDANQAGEDCRNPAGSTESGQHRRKASPMELADRRARSDDDTLNVVGDPFSAHSNPQQTWPPTYPQPATDSLPSDFKMDGGSPGSAATESSTHCWCLSVLKHTPTPPITRTCKTKPNQTVPRGPSQVLPRRLRHLQEALSWKNPAR